ncbi:MAG: glycosyltransferase family 9 protein [Chitinophagaceae bacterium]|nr:glycosyltransferase family 9 protein [Chitinophagaceae bacterium]
MKFLVIRFSSIGDIVLASPVVRCLKKQILTAEVHFLTKSSFRIVTESNPYIDKFFYYDNNLPELIAALKEEQYDYILDLHNNFRSIKIKRALGVQHYTIRKLNFQKLALTKLRIDRMPGRHITLRSLDTASAFGVKDDGLGLDYFIPEKDRIKEQDLPASHLAGYIAIVIGASYYTKKLPPHKLKALCERIDHPIILVGGEEDREAGEYAAGSDKIRIYNACGKFNLNESADIVRRAKLVISHDTGLQYIAAAFNKPILAIWGSTSPRLDVEPWYGSGYLSSFRQIAASQLNPGAATAQPLQTTHAQEMKMQENRPAVSEAGMSASREGSPVADERMLKPYENIMVPGLRCQPCSKYGNRRCPLGHFNCMEKMDIDYIAERIKLRLKR